jgi:hypothetical protein
MTLDGSGLKAGKVIPVRVTDLDEGKHRRALAEGINHVAAAAYTPITQLQTVEDVDLTEPGVDLGFEIVVTPYVPARAHILLVLFVTNSDAVADLNSEFELNENGTPIADPTLFLAAQTSGQVVYQALRDLEPNTTYTYTVTGYEAAAQVGLVGEFSSLSVRIEHRMLT